MRLCRFAPVLLAIAMLVSRAAEAGLADPTPTLGGQPSFHLWSVPGVENDGLSTVFACSNATLNPIRVGVEVFGPGGGVSLNNASATSLVLPAGGTASFGTSQTVGYPANSLLLPGLVSQGSARILATSNTGIICSAVLLNSDSAPPQLMTNLTIISPNTQAMASSSSPFGTTVLAGLLLATGATAAMMMRRGSVA